MQSTTTAPAIARELADNAPKTAKSGPYLPLRGGGTLRTRQAAWLLAAVVVLALLAAASLAVGARGLSLGTVWQAQTQIDPSSGDHAVIQARIPRTVLGLLVGSALGLAGAAMQGVARNPLADPGIMGVNAGAALAVVTGIYVFGVTSLPGYIWFA
jgi:iron complex transport system permease protein